MGNFERASKILLLNQLCLDDPLYNALFCCTICQYDFFYFGDKLFEMGDETKKEKMFGIINEVKRKMFLSPSPQESQHLNSPVY